ncbi:hypothetical protein [Clostridium botulinum]|uniref:hypothetical protein n=1 Tax=Clostridium botulinum TaxID=1491 RepID=UPI000ADC633F|nr:hypothetical protein [Clostridium botulinum]
MGLLDGMFEVRKDITKVEGYYQGGYANFGTKGNMAVQIEKNKLVLKQFWKKRYELDIKDIKDVQFKTEEEITKDVTLTRLLVLGIFALGVKKKRKKERCFLIITTEEEGFTNDIILEMNALEGIGSVMAQGFVKTLRKEVIKYRD